MKKEAYFEEKRRIFGVDGAQEAAAYCRERWPLETAHVLRCAGDACENRFVFDFPWDMERTWEVYDFGERPDWNRIPYGDREFLWQLNRHRFSLCLGQAYLLTGEERFAQHFVRLFTDWTERAREGENIDLGPWRTLETGIRAENWIRTLFLLESSPCLDDTFLNAFLGQLERHGERLLRNFKPHKYQSNWGVLESTGLFLIGLALPEGERQRLFLKTAVDRLTVTARLQVMGDGTDWEQSPMYHNEVYRSFLIAAYYGERAGCGVQPRHGEREDCGVQTRHGEWPGCGTKPDDEGGLDTVKAAVRRMAFADLAWMKPDHTQFAQGDSDATDLRDQLTAGAYFLREPVLKFVGFPCLDFESAWLFGAEACREYEAMDSRKPDFTSIALSDSGNYYLRSGWEENANLLHFHCGDMGAAHGHADKLHVDLVINGEDILVDSGRYTYVDGEERYALKGVRGHNTTLVDGIAFTELQDSWVCSRLSTAVKRQYRDGRLAAFVEGAHLGYLEKGVWVNRKILWIKPNIYVIADEFYPCGDNGITGKAIAGKAVKGKAAAEHTCQALFHFAAGGGVDIIGGVKINGGVDISGGMKINGGVDISGGEKIKGSLARFEGRENEAFLQFPDRDVRLTVQETIQSLYYNQISANRTLTASRRARGFQSLITVINGGKKGETQPAAVSRLTPRSVAQERTFAEEEAEAFSIASEGREYVVFIAHREIFSPADTAVIGNCMGYGSVIVFDVTEGGFLGAGEIVTGEVLSW